MLFRSLIAAGEIYSSVVQQGIRWLKDHQLPDGTWEESVTTGTGFPQVFYIHYHLYKDYFPILALGTYAKSVNKA